MVLRHPGRWQLELKTALFPLYLVSKVCCVNAFAYRWPPAARPPTTVPRKGQVVIPLPDEEDSTPAPLALSLVGILHAVGCSAGYAAYHIHSSLGQSSKLTDTNLVRVAIDLKNQYIGCVLVLALVGVSLLRQPTVGALMRRLGRVEQKLVSIRTEMLAGGLRTVPFVDNAVWLRNVLLLLVASVGAKAVLEFNNCLMYIRDSGSPFSSYCLALCIVPQTVCLVCELQTVAYALLLRDRFALLNRWLEQLSPQLAGGRTTAFLALGRIAAVHDDLLGAVRLLNRAFGLQNTVLLLNQFVTLVELGYNSCMMIVRYGDDGVQEHDSTEDFFETVTWALWFVLEMFVLCYCCHRAVAEAKHFAGLLRLPASYKLDQRAHFRLVSLGHVALMDRKIRITGCGLFNVDLGLLYAIIGATSTYLIILIQFDQSYNGE